MVHAEQEIRESRLGEIASVRSGYQFRGPLRPDPAGTVRVIQIKDIADGHLAAQPDLIHVRLDRSPDPYLIQRNDVLFLSRGQRLSAIAIDQPLNATITYSYFYIVRLHPRVDVIPQYLAWYINQPTAQAFLRSVHEGSNMPLPPPTRFW